MIISKTSVALSMTVIALIFACQAEVVQDSRSAASGTTSAQPVKQEGDANADDKKAETPAGNTGTPPAGTPVAPATYTMTWDVSTDPALVSYKVFVVPPDRNPRFPGKTDIPIQVKNYPIAGLQKVGAKYSVTVTSDEVKAALGATTVSAAAYCFTVVAVNGVGNSTHSPVICP